MDSKKHTDKEISLSILFQVNNAGVGGMTGDYQAIASLPVFSEEVKISADIGITRNSLEL